MKRAMVWVALAALVAVGCGKKDEGSESQATAKGTEPAAGKTCDKGQVLEGDQCVAVVTPEKVQAVEAQVSRLDEIEKKLDEVTKLAAAIEVVDLIRQLDAWKKAAASSSKFQKVDEMVATLKQGSEQLVAFNAQLKASKARLSDLSSTLKGIYESSGAARTLADARAQVSGEVRAAIEPLQAQVTQLVVVIEPALGELSKLEDIIGGVCAMGSLYGGGADFEKLCATGKEAFASAVDFLEANKDAPKTLLSDLVSKLETELDTLMDAQAKQLMDQAQAAVDKALEPTAPAGGQ